MANTEVLSVGEQGSMRWQFDIAKLFLQFFLHVKYFHRNVMPVKDTGSTVAEIELLYLQER